MNTLFGVSLDAIMAVTLGLFLAITTVVAVLALRNRLMFKLGLRNIPRRRAQTILIVVGLMLSTLIITSAFGTGDTMSYSIRSGALTNLGTIDEIVTGNATAAGNTQQYIPASLSGRVQRILAPGRNADGVTGAIVQAVAVQDLTSRQTKASTQLLGVPAGYPSAFGALVADNGSAVTLGQLGPDEIYINDVAATALSAHAGDRLAIYANGRPTAVTVRAVVRTRDLAAGGLISGGFTASPEVLMPLGRAQRLAGQPGMINMVLISNNGDALTGASLSDNVTGALRVALANTAAVANIKAILNAPAGRAGLHALHNDKSLSTVTKSKLRSLEAQLTAPGVSATLTSLVIDTSVDSALRSIKTPAVATSLDTTLATISDYTVQSVKQDGLTAADQIGNEFSSIFIVFGLFSIAAGIMLIFLIFVMLAAERRAEMGMARAVGTKRRHLIQQFLFEGYAYDLGAALVGAGIGVAVGLGMVSIISSLLGTFGLALQPQISARSVIIAFSLGALVTFITVAVSAWRVSRLNIVAAIRDLPDDLHIDGSIRAAFTRPWHDLTLAGRRLRGRRILSGLGALIAAPWHFLTAFRVFISRGPLLALAGYLLVNAGISAKELFQFNLGISLLLIGAALMLRWALAMAHVAERLRNRIGFTLAGLALVVFWLLPFDAIRSDLHFDIEMFFLAGLMLVLGGVWTVMYNSDVLLGALMALVGRAGSLAPVMKTAVTYPMQNRFRTGLTLSMFSLVIFTLMVMSVLTSSFGGQTLNLNRDSGGYDIYGSVSPLNPVRNVASAVAANPTLRNRVSASGSLATMRVTLRQPGQTWKVGRLNVADSAYLASTRYTLHNRANGYSSDAQVWNAVRTHPGYAVVSGNFAGNGGADVSIKALNYNAAHFTPLRLDVRDPNSGAIVSLTVIGVIDQQSYYAEGMYTSVGTLTAVHLPTPAPTDLYVRVAPGQDIHKTALALGSAFLANGLDVKETRVEYANDRAVGVGINYLLEGFMALGLVVGIAALGVVATRSVVERRQQIGMLRAIGFKRRMVQASFLLESSVISVVGTALGVVLGLMLARQLIAHFAKTNTSLQLVIPWAQIGGIVLLAYLASLLTTYLPAWQASRIYPAEALRYE